MLKAQLSAVQSERVESAGEWRLKEEQWEERLATMAKAMERQREERERAREVHPSILRIHRPRLPSTSPPSSDAVHAHSSPIAVCVRVGGGGDARRDGAAHALSQS